MKHKEVYVGRTTEGNYEVCTHKDDWNNAKGWMVKGLIGDFCGKDFEAVTGLILPIPSKPIKVLFSIEEIEKTK